METSEKKILGIDWIRRLARRFTSEQFRQQYLAKPLAQQRMEEQVKRRTDEELMAAFPECDRIKREQAAPIVVQVMNEADSWRKLRYTIQARLQKQFWPEPEYDSEEYKEWREYFYGWSDNRFDKWTRLVEWEYVYRHGQRHTMEEACQIAADEWTRMIFGNHIQDNGDQSDAGGLAMALGTLAKDRAKRGISSEVIERFRKLCKEYYLGGCRYNDGKYGWVNSEPYCDYGPNGALGRLLEQAGVPDNSIGSICPWKTGITVDERDHAVIVRGYHKERYI